MPKHLSRFASPALFTLVGLLLYWFWAVPYRAALSYREQLQLFQTTGSYFDALMARPAGPVAYLGEFLTQFFNNYYVGGLVMALLLTLFMLLCYYVVRRFAPAASRYISWAIAAIPLISLLLFLGNPDVTLTFVVALIIVMGGTCWFVSIAKPATLFVVMILLTALLYWLAGPATLVFTLLAIAWCFIRNDASMAIKAVFTILALAWLAVNVWIWSAFISWPVSYQLIGVGYAMMPDTLYTGLFVTETLCVLAPLAAVALFRLPQKILLPSIVVLELAAFVLLYPVAYNATTYQLIDYDYMVRANNWGAILQRSEKDDPDLPLCVSATNLAAAMTGQLDSRAFDFFQHGPEGLVPPFVKETLSSWTTGEILFQLGMVNSAQRFYFEGMEAIPNYNKSSRAIKRLAETAIIRGDYPLARKYLSMLENTLFYKKWAQRNLQLIKNPAEVDRHPLYGTLRHRMIGEDYMFSEGELDKTFGQLFLKDPSNQLAKQYLVVYPLLQRNLHKFTQYMGVVAEVEPNYNPLLAQQAVAFMSMKSGQPVPRNMVPEAVENSLRTFAQAWTSKNPELIAPFRRSLYHYLLSQE